ILLRGEIRHFVQDDGKPWRARAIARRESALSSSAAMPSPPVAPRRHFLSWEQTWLPQATAWLARDWSGLGPLDLSGTLVLVPTRQSGRRLREALAALAHARRGAV